MAAASRESDTARTAEVAPQTDSNAVSDLRPHSMPPSAAEINQSSAGAQQAAQEAINKQFGPLTITDTGAAKLCDKRDQAPKDAHSIGVNPETGAKQGFIWQNGHGYALSTDGKGRADVCVEYANGTKVGMTGEMVTNPTPGGMPIKPDKVEVLSNGGKMQFEKAPDGSTIMHATDPHRNTQDFPVNGSLTDAGVQATRHPNYQVHWAESGPKGLSFFPTSDQDAPSRREQFKAWQSRHPQEIK